MEDDTDKSYGGGGTHLISKEDDTDKPWGGWGGGGIHLTSMEGDTDKPYGGEEHTLSVWEIAVS